MVFTCPQPPLPSRGQGTTYRRDSSEEMGHALVHQAAGVLGWQPYREERAQRGWPNPLRQAPV